MNFHVFLTYLMFYCRGETESAGGEPYSANDITDALNETANDSRGDTTMEGEVTQDSVAM